MNENNNYFPSKRRIFVFFFFLAAQRYVTSIEKWLKFLESLGRVGVYDDVNYVERVTH